jgi:hypothetical protein
MNVDMPSRIRDLLMLAPARAAYANLQMLGCAVEKSRSMEWGVVNAEGVPVITLWDVCMSVGPANTAFCDIPVREWIGASDGAHVARAQRLLEILAGNVGKAVRGLICEEKKTDGKVAIKRSAADLCKWLVTELSEGNFRLIRQDRYAREAAG